MNKTFLILLVACCLLMSCADAPEKQFGIAALNCNLLYGFAGDGMQRELASPSVKLVDEKTLATAPMKRSEVISEKLESLQTNYEKVKKLSSNDENKEMLNASLALYEFTLPVYKKEYTELAALYDGGAGADKIAAAEKSINEKYGVKFEELYNAVITTGTAYAEKHGIPVKQVNPSPSK